MIRANFPLQSSFLNDQLDEAYGTLIGLIGYISPSGTADVTGLYDTLDDTLYGLAGYLAQKETERLPLIMQLMEEFDMTRSHDPE